MATCTSGPGPRREPSTDAVTGLKEQPLAAVAEEATRLAEQWAAKAGVRVELVTTEKAARQVASVLGAVWSGADPSLPVTPELSWALAHSGNYVSVVRAAGVPVAAAVAFRGADDEGVHLHSHIVGVRPDFQGNGIGFALKQDQRAWALAAGIPRLTWTFDPLVIRNAYFNVMKLGARLTRYYVDFYGTLADGINGGDESDRCLVTWWLAEPATVVAATGGAIDAPDLDRAGLGTVVDRLHPAVLDVMAAPLGLDVTVSHPVILDPSEPVAPDPGGVILAVGVDNPIARANVLRRLEGTGVAAVVFKQAGPPDPGLLAVADATGIALLGVRPGASWGQVYSLLVTASAAGPQAEEGLHGVPLGDLFALANGVAAMVGGATTIEDPQSRILAYSSLSHPIDVHRQETILGRQVPSEWMQRLRDAGVFRRLWQTDEVVQIRDFSDFPGYLPRVAVSVRAGGELLGTSPPTPAACWPRSISSRTSRPCCARPGRRSPRSSPPSSSACSPTTGTSTWWPRARPRA